MAQIVLGIGSSHTPMLNADAEDLPLFVELDSKRSNLDKEGRPTTYDELVRANIGKLDEFITPEYMAKRLERTEAQITRLAKVLESAKLDALIVVGDDQKELYQPDNMPGMLIYWGDTIRNAPLHLIPSSRPDWMMHVRGRNYEQSEPREFPVDSKLALHLINWLMDRDFDPAVGSEIPEGLGEGHALGFVHKRLMTGSIIPVLPIFLNTYFPPNQPRPKRCYRLGQEIRAAVRDFPGDSRVGIIASGGLSHFTVNEELDQKIIRAMREKDAATLQSIPMNKLKDGNSEILNWIVLAGAVEDLRLDWAEYYPGYRTQAGTGTGMGFASWS